MGGILPFGCIFIQLFFILNSIWSVLMWSSWCTLESEYINGYSVLLFYLALWITDHETNRFRFTNQCKSLMLQVSSDVLYVWISLPGLHHPGHHLLWGHHPPVLLPPVCWGDSTYTWPYACFGELWIFFIHLFCVSSRRTITGSGVPSWPADSQLFIFWSMPSITSSLSYRSVDSPALFFTLATPWSWHSSSSSLQVCVCVEQ